MIALTALFIAVVTLPPQDREAIPSSAPLERAPVRGVVIDTKSNKPVAGTSVRLFQGRLKETVWTDERGHFVTANPFPRGTILVHAWDDPAPHQRYSTSFSKLEFAPEMALGTIHECRLDVGIRYELDIEIPARWTLDDVSALAVGKYPNGVARPALTTIHPDDPPWIRIRPWELTTEDETTLRLRTLDGFYAASTQLGMEPAPGHVAKIEFVPCGILIVRTFGDGPGRPRPVSIHLTPTGHETGEQREAITTSTVLGADVRIQWIPPGEWLITAESAYFQTKTAPIHIAPLGVTRTAIQLEGELPVGALRIVVAEEVGDVCNWSGISGSPSLSATVDEIGGDLSFRIVTSSFCGTGIASWFRRVHRDGRFVCEATLKEVPAGEYLVTVESNRLLDRWHARIQPDETVTFTHPYEIPETAHGLRVVEAPMNRATSRYFLSPVGDDPLFPLSRRPTKEGLHGLDLPGDDPGEWFVHSNGFRRVYGSSASFHPAAPPERGHWADVILKPGFGIRLRAEDRSGTPRPGVEVGFDGGSFRTDAAGHAYLFSSNLQPAPRIDIERWKIVGGNVQPDGTFPRSQPGLPALSELFVVLD